MYHTVAILGVWSRSSNKGRAGGVLAGKVQQGNTGTVTVNSGPKKHFLGSEYVSENIVSQNIPWVLKVF